MAKHQSENLTFSQKTFRKSSRLDRKSPYHFGFQTIRVFTVSKPARFLSTKKTQINQQPCILILKWIILGSNNLDSNHV